MPRYEAKLVEDVDKQYVEDDVVLLRRTEWGTGHERICHYPREVFEGIAEHLR